MATMWSNKYYCDTNQTTSYWDIDLSLTTRLQQNELIDEKTYNEMFASLKAIHDFGKYDDGTRLPNINNKLELKNDMLISKEYYNDIAQRIGIEQTVSQNDIIYGTYFSDLWDTIKDYKIPRSRYYKESYYCCDHCDDCCVYTPSSSGGGGCGSCNMCMDSFDNGCSSGQGGACGCYANGTMP